MILIFIVNLLGVAHPYILKSVIDKFTVDKSAEGVQDMLGGLHGMQPLQVLMIMYCAVWVLNFIFQYIRNWKTNKIVSNIMKNLRTELFDTVIKFKMKTYLKYKTSDIYTRLTSDVENASKMFSDSIPKIINNVIYILFILIAMFTVNIQLALIGTVIVAIITCISYFFVKVLGRISYQTQSERDKENNESSELYNKSKLTHLFGLQKKNIIKIHKIVDKQLTFRRKYIFTHHFMTPLIGVLEAVGIYAIVYYVLNINIGISLGTTYIFLYYIKQCYDPLKETFNELEELQEAKNSVTRIDKLLEDNKEYEDIDTGNNIVNLHGNIEFKDVYFKYDNAEILNNVSFSINKGEKVAFVGKTGVGKTTITNILMRLYDICDGKVLVDGHDISKVSIKSIRKNISYISQNAYLLQDTLRNNIILDKQNISDEKIFEIVDKIGVRGLIDKLDNGLDEVINVDRLSRGEVQIIAFIRAILHKANIYIFDEPTSNIDLKTEKMLQNIIDAISKTSTVIIIAHRLATIQSVDKVIYLKDKTVEKVKINV